jgi:replication factor C subunit 2/4
LHDAIIPLATVGTVQKSLTSMAIAECDKALNEGGDEELQLLECCIRIRDAMARS